MTIKKIIIFLLMSSITILAYQIPIFASQTILTEETNMIHGAYHKRVQRHLHVGSSNVLQTYHVLGADFNEAPFEIITGDNYSQTSYGGGTVLKHAQNAQQRHDEYIVIGGVNADFFEGAAVPQEAYVRDGEVISQGIGYANRDVIGFKSDGSVVFGKPVFGQYEIIVRDENMKERIRLPIQTINGAYQQDPHHVYAYFDTYAQSLPAGVNKYVLDVVEQKGAMPKIYGRGEVSQIRQLATRFVQSGQIVIVSNNIYLYHLIENGDIVTVQRQMTGDFEGVEWAIGAYGKLVNQGQKHSPLIGIDPTFRHPRTAIGIKEDGSVFFVALDGRQVGYSSGATNHELADLMIELGAYTAYNLDGGGSTQMVVLDNDHFAVANQPSQIPYRQVTNSVLLALRVADKDQTPHPIPDFSEKLDEVSNITYSASRLMWSSVTNLTKYEIMINGEIYTTTLNNMSLASIATEIGTYEIKIRAIGDGLMYSNSNWSETFIYEYEGPKVLEVPHMFSLSANGILTWDTDNPWSSYTFIVEDRSYILTINRFNLVTLGLSPGIYEIKVRKNGDQYDHQHSNYSIYEYRIYSDLENEVKYAFELIKEILFFGSRD
jgi:hypothetical protein